MFHMILLGLQISSPSFVPLRPSDLSGKFYEQLYGTLILSNLIGGSFLNQSEHLKPE